VAGSRFATWVRDYDAASIDAAVPPPATLSARAEAMACIVTSNLKRARESARLVAPNRPILSDALFAEAEIPAAIPLRLALAPRYWSVFARVLWFCGWSRGVESLREARVRAQRAAERLAALAVEHGSVMLVGHGMMNWLIARALRRGGWSGAASRFAFWSVTALQRVA
jgi:broad specificity phosphatase PhoE